MHVNHANPNWYKHSECQQQQWLSRSISATAGVTPFSRVVSGVTQLIMIKNADTITNICSEQVSRLTIGFLAFNVVSIPLRPAQYVRHKRRSEVVAVLRQTCSRQPSLSRAFDIMQIAPMMRQQVILVP